MATIEKKEHSPSDVAVAIHEYKAVIICSCNTRIVAYDQQAERAIKRAQRAINAHLVGAGSGHKVLV